MAPSPEIWAFDDNPEVMALIETETQRQFELRCKEEDRAKRLDFFLQRCRLLLAPVEAIPF